MTNGQRVVATALQFEGIHEASGRNDGRLIEEWQREAARAHGYSEHTYRGQPWCAMFCKAVYRRAEVQAPERLTHPYTGYICQEADRLGGLRTSGPAPPGSMMIKCGTHVGFVVRDRGDGLLDTIEGNAGNAVRRLVRRSADWRIIVPEALMDEPAEPAVEMRDSYGFDDLETKPRLFGGWPTPEARDERMAAFRAARPGLWTAAVHLDRPSPYAFRAGRPGTHGERWRYGGWTTKEIREERIEAFESRHGHRNVRRWRRRVPVPAEMPAAAPSPDISMT